MDRFDLRVEVPSVAFTGLDLPADGETSTQVAAARDIQSARFSGQDHLRVNADLEGVAGVRKPQIADRRGC
ncbi:MAG: magnesium chelatase family protein [Yoonia sp.]|jgi:magnesium chelatase family protein